MSQLFQIKMTRTSPRHQQGNRKAECFNRTLISMIKFFISANRNGQQNEEIHKEENSTCYYIFDTGIARCKLQTFPMLLMNTPLFKKTNKINFNFVYLQINNHLVLLNNSFSFYVKYFSPPFIQL